VGCRQRIPAFIVLDEPLVRLQAVNTSYLEVIKHGNWHCIEVVELGIVVHDPGSMSDLVNSSGTKERQELSITCIVAGFGQRLI